jgi:hypothetical protein
LVALLQTPMNYRWLHSHCCYRDEYFSMASNASMAWASDYHGLKTENDRRLLEKKILPHEVLLPLLERWAQLHQKTRAAASVHNAPWKVVQRAAFRKQHDLFARRSHRTENHPSSFRFPK